MLTIPQVNIPPPQHHRHWNHKEVLAEAEGYHLLLEEQAKLLFSRLSDSSTSDKIRTEIKVNCQYNTQSHAHTQTYTRTCAHTHTHTHAHAYTHTHTHISISPYLCLLQYLLDHSGKFIQVLKENQVIVITCLSCDTFLPSTLAIQSCHCFLSALCVGVPIYSFLVFLSIQASN